MLRFENLVTVSRIPGRRSLHDIPQPLQPGVDDIALQREALAPDQVRVGGLQAHGAVPEPGGPPLEVQRAPLDEVEAFLREQMGVVVRIALAHGCQECPLGLLNHTVCIVRVEVAGQRIRFVDPGRGEDVVHGLAGGLQDFLLGAGAMVLEILFAALRDFEIALASSYGYSVSM